MSKSLRKYSLFALPFLVIALAACHPTTSDDGSNSISPPTSGTSDGTSAGEVEDYYTINTSTIIQEMLVDTEVALNPSFQNLGEAANPPYKVEVKLDGTQDITTRVYNHDTKVFAPTDIGSHEITFTVLNEQGEVLTVSGGVTFSAKVTIEVVIQSFAALASEGPDVSVDESGEVAKLIFGSSYTEGDKLIDSGQYKVTGLSFGGSYSITYLLEDIAYSPTFADPAFYFGWTRNTIDAQDDCFKVSTGDGTVSTWIWGTNGLADLSSNLDHGWFHNVWFNAPGSVSENSPISGNHTITFERFVNEETKTATYGIKYDGVPFNFLEIGKNYTDLLSNVWIESNNTAGKISVANFGPIEDNVSPEVTLSYSEYTTDDTIHLGSGVSITDNGDYGHLIVPHFKVVGPDGNEVSVHEKAFDPVLVGDYEVTCSVHDIAGNKAEATTTITVTEPAVMPYEFNLEMMSPVARTGTGIVLYYSVTQDGTPVEVDEVKILKGNSLETAEDVTATMYEVVESADKSLKFEVFTPNAEGIYLLKLTVDGNVRTKQISVTDSCSEVYGQKYWENAYNNFIMGRNTYIYRNVPSGGSVGKIGNNFARKTNWTLSFDITDLKFSAQGKFGVTLASGKANGDFGGWEDLAIGGNINDDLWGYETSTVGTGWQTYQWRSNWQDPTTEFMPDPSDHTIGCGRDAAAYKQYAVGTHNYRIECRTDASGAVTYSFYIDNMIEAVHRLPAGHNDINSTDFMQFWSNNMNGIITNFAFV